MELNEILKQPDGFTPPDVTVKIEKVWDYKSGESEQGPWSFQDLVVVGGGRLKLKGLPEFPKAREGQTVTIRANQSKTHGLTGMKVAHELYQGKAYDKLVITNSAKWDFADANGNAPSAPQSPTSAPQQPALTYTASDGVEDYLDHLRAVAVFTDEIATRLGIGTDPHAVQACFATIVIDSKQRGIFLPADLPSVALTEPTETTGSSFTAADAAAEADAAEDPSDPDYVPF